MCHSFLSSLEYKQQNIIKQLQACPSTDGTVVGWSRGASKWREKVTSHISTTLSGAHVTPRSEGRGEPHYTIHCENNVNWATSVMFAIPLILYF